MPEFIEKDQAAAYYDQGTLDGKRPGRVDVNLYHATERSLAPVEAVSYHEGIPGHHLQIALGQEMTGVPAFRTQSYYTAFTEGWALYSERLGKEIGFYQDPYSDYGRLEADVWRAIRLVVDTGVHSQHWTRAQMVGLLPRALGDRRDECAGGDGPVYCVAGAGAGIQDGPDEDSGAAGAGAGGRWARSSG